MTGRWRVRPADRPAGRQMPPKGADEASFVSCPARSVRGYFAPRRELLLSAVTKVAKSTGRNCVSALPQRAMPVRFRPRFPSRNRRFPDRCRSPDCASTAFRCRCLLLRQKLFVLPCRRLRNNYILCPTGTPTHCGASRRNGRDLIIATRPAHQPLPSLLSAAAAQAHYLSPTGIISRPDASYFCLR